MSASVAILIVTKLYPTNCQSGEAVHALKVEIEVFPDQEAGDFA